MDANQGKAGRAQVISKISHDESAQGPAYTDSRARQPFALGAKSVQKEQPRERGEGAGSKTENMVRDARPSQLDCARCSKQLSKTATASSQASGDKSHPEVGLSEDWVSITAY